MFDYVQAFASQFTPTDGGYLYYSSRKSGAKLVTEDEYRDFVETWKRRVSPWKTAGIASLLIVAWILLSENAAIPDWGESVFISVMVLTLSGWMIWASYAPKRLLKDRPEIAPARPLADSKRRARAALNWFVVLSFLIVSGTIFAARLWFPESTLSWWAWTVGSGLMFVAYARIAFLKFRDQRHTPRGA